MATRTDIREDVYRANRLNLRIPIVDEDDQPQTMTGWTLAFVVRRKATGGEGDVLFSMETPTITLDNSTVSTTDDVAVVPFTAAQTNDVIETRTYEYSLSRTDAGDPVLLKWGDLKFISAGRPV